MSLLLPAIPAILSTPFYTCQAVDRTRVSSFCRGETLPVRTCVDPAGYKYNKDKHHFEKQARQCDSKHERKNVCPLTPSRCRALTYDEYCGQFDQSCRTDSDCLPTCYSDCYPCNDAADCDTLVAFGVLAAPNDTACFDLYNHSSRPQAQIAAAEVAPAAAQAPAIEAAPADIVSPFPFPYDWGRAPVAWFGGNATNYENRSQLDALGRYSLAIFGWQHLIFATNWSGAVYAQLAQAAALKAAQPALPVLLYAGFGNADGYNAATWPIIKSASDGCPHHQPCRKVAPP